MHFSKKAMMTRMQDLLIEEKMELTKSKTWILIEAKYSLQGTTQGRYLTGGVPPVRFSM